MIPNNVPKKALPSRAFTMNDSYFEADINKTNQFNINHLIQLLRTRYVSVCSHSDLWGCLNFSRLYFFQASLLFSIRVAH